MSRPNDTSSPRPGDDDGAADDRSPEARLIDAALAELDAADVSVDAANPYDEVVAAATAALIAPAAVRPDLAARLTAMGMEQVRARSRQAGGGGGTAPMRIGPSTAVGDRRTNWAAWTGWAVAVAACLALAVTALRTPTPSAGPGEVGVAANEDVSVARQRFIASARQADPGFVAADWTPGNTPDKVSGDVVWSDREQRGFLRFAGLPKNDPEKWVYQLWIFDAEGDQRYPVDGGVFSIVAADPQTGEAIVKIDPKIKVGKGVMFAVTIEKPGGVVVSDRSKIVALAKTS